MDLSHYDMLIEHWWNVWIDSGESDSTAFENYHKLKDKKREIELNHITDESKKQLIQKAIQRYPDSTPSDWIIREVKPYSGEPIVFEEGEEIMGTDISDKAGLIFIKKAKE